MMKKIPIFFTSVLTALYFCFPLIVLSAPSIAAFDISPLSGASGYPFSLTWALNDAGGSSLIIPCADGIIAKNMSTGAVIVCDAKVSFSNAASDGFLLKLINISGTGKTISIKLIPKDTAGADQDAFAKSVSVSVSPAAQVVEYFKTSATTTDIGKPITLSWDIPDASGANISMGCNDGVRATSPSYLSGNLPCNKQIFSTALGKTSTLTISFVNSNAGSMPVSFILFPAIGTNIYNGINTESIVVDVISDIVPDPVVNYFKTPSPQTVLSGQNINFSWSTENTKGVNFKISCADLVTATSSVDSDVNLTCDKYALTDLLGSNGSMSLAFQNKNTVSKNITVTIYPAFKNKEGYDATESKSLVFEVRSVSFMVLTPASEIQPASTPIPTPTPTAVSLPSPTAAPAVKAIPTPTPKPSAKPSATIIKTLPSVTPEPTPEPPSVSEATTSPETGDYDAIESDKDAKIKNAQEVSKDLIAKKQVDEVADIEFNSAENIYDVRGLRNVKLFYLIPVKIKVSLKVDAESGDVKKTYFSWWSFFVSFKQ